MTPTRSLTSPAMSVALIAYYGLNYLLLGPLMTYLWLRGRRDPLYKKYLPERFGFYTARLAEQTRPVWVHAVSLGELRSAVPLITALLKQGEHVVTTHFTPAGRREAEKAFKGDITAGRLVVIYVPLELGIAFRRFYRQFNPKYGLVMEVEFWPCMILSAKKAGIPLFLCNGQYPTRSFERDTKGFGFRARVVQGFAGVMVKSDLQADRFKSIGLNNIAVTGELRFEQPVPALHTLKGHQAKETLNIESCIAIASAVAGEDDIYIETIQAIRAACKRSKINPPLFIYIPRAPERFEEVNDLLTASGLAVIRRSKLFDEQMNLNELSQSMDVLLGDSMGEMYFYLSMANQVIVGGGFTPNGAHNISEAFALSKPVLVGPSIWTIEYPAFEAIEAGVLFKATDQNALESELFRIINSQNSVVVSADAVDQFFKKHTGAINKTLMAIPELLAALSTNR